ncbi:MAG: polysaccharide biosynthesis tyrosine autokinase [Xanthobacteraceae bacterium]
MNVGFRIPTNLDAEQAERAFDLRRYLNFVWRNWLFIVAVTAIAFLIGIVNLVRAVPLYTASTQVLLERHEKAPGLDTGNDRRFDDDSYLDNQLAILGSDSLLRRVVLKERLADRPSVATQSQNSDHKSNAAEEAAATTEDDQSIRAAINRLRGALAISHSGGAQVFNISITWDDPVRAGQLANAVADAYVVDQLDARLESAKRASGWLSDRIVELRQQLRDSEDAVATFRRQHGLTRSGPTVALNDQQIADLNGKLIAARTDAAEKKARVDFVTDLAAGKKTLDLLPDSLQSSAPLIAALRGKLAEASQREADLLARYSRSYPAVVNVEAEKRDIERSIAAETQRMAESVKGDYALAKARLDAIQQAMDEATGQGAPDNEVAVQLRELERTAAVNKTLFEDFLQKAKVTDEEATFRARDVRVIMPAQAGGQSFPDSRKVLLTALLAGLGLGVGGAFAMEKLRAGFTSPREVEEALGIPVLASVRRLKKSDLVTDGKTIPVPYYQIQHPLSAFSESMRTLRSGIHMSDVDQPPRVIQVTSALPGEGKTTIAISLAISAAFAGLKVALVDADLRHPAASRFFKLEKENGLVDLLTGNTDNALRFYKDLKLTVIPAGSKSLNPTDVLGSERMKALIAHLKETFDYVVVDTPPVGPVVDAVIISVLADKTIFVVQWASTPRELVEATVKRVSVQKRVAGIVFNFINQDRARKYGGEDYYGKAYDKYYSE